MKYIKYFAVIIFVAAIVGFVSAPASAQQLSIAQLKALIQSLLLQVQVLQAKLNLLIASSGSGTGTNPLPLPPIINQTGSSMNYNYDVVVVGAGTGGSAAAIQAARMGMRVALLEKTDWIGGQATAAAVSRMDSGSLDNSGIYKEFVDRVKSYYNNHGKTQSICYNDYSICFEPSVGQSILKQMMSEAAQTVVNGKKAALDIFTGNSVTLVYKSGNIVTGVKTNLNNRFNTKVVIDATEYGDVIPLTGARYRIGNGTSDNPNPNACVQDITYVTMMKKYPNGVPQGLFMTTPPGPATGPESYAQRVQSFAQIVMATGSPIFAQYPVNFPVHNSYRETPDSSNSYDYPPSEPQNITKTGVNWANDYPTLAPYIFDDPNVRLSKQYIEDKTYRSQIDCKAKLKTLQFIYYVQHDLGQPLWSVANDEGYDTAYNIQQNSCSNIDSQYKTLEKYMAVMPYTRESRRIIGMTTVTAKNIKRTQKVGSIVKSEYDYPNSIAVGDYPDDLHNCKTNDTLESSLNETRNDIPTPNITGTFGVPFESLIPETVDGFIAAEKNISVSRLAQGAIRLQPITMNTGESAGTIASLAVLNNIQPRNVRPELVQKELVQDGQMISPYIYTDVPQSNIFWKAVQFVSARGILVGYGNGTFGVNDSLTRAQAAVILAKSAKLNISNPPSTPTFQDVGVNDFGYANIEAIYKAGITAGCSTSPMKFCPNDIISRWQFAVLLSKALKFDISDVSQTPDFTDVPASAAYFKYVQYLYENGITAGCSSNPMKFCPNDNISRGQASVFIAQSLWK